MANGITKTTISDTVSPTMQEDFGTEMHDALLEPRKLLEQFMRIPSVSGKEQRAAQWLTQHAKLGNFEDVYTDEMSNVVCVRGDGDHTVLITGCLDTYRGHIPVRIEHNELYGRGAVHAKGPLIAGLSAVHQLDEDALDGKTVIIAGCVNTLDNEQNGVKHVIDTYTPDSVIHLEPTGWDTIVHSHKGGYGFYFNYSRPNAHYTAIQRRSAEVTLEFIDKLRRQLNILYPNRHSGNMNDHLSSAHIEIHSFNTTNDGLHDSTTMKMNIRYPHDFAINEFKEFIHDQKGDAEISDWVEMPASNMDLDTALVELFEQAIHSHDGNAQRQKRPTSSGASLYTQSWSSIPIICYGPGDYELDRTPDERIHLDEFDRSIAILKQVLTDIT
jgi:[amino group carrier protein]-lysine/ornithine hydrolase